MQREGVSIIICCYNSSLRIEETLRYIAALQTNGINCEVVLVDNASTDNTADIARLVWQKLGNNKINFHIAYQPTPGLTYAREKGIHEAHFEYLVFCDDDNWLDENYIQNTAGFFRSEPKLAVLGGVGIPEFEDPLSKPIWFEKFYHGYAVGPQAEKECFVNGVYGAGMAVRKSVLIKVMNKYPMFLHGRKQNQLTSGEDGEICYRIILEGYQVLYSPQLKFKHFLITQRLTWDYLKRLHIGLSQIFVVINLYEKALNAESSKLSYFNWLKKAFYYWGIYLKYWPKHYLAHKNGEGSIEEIHHLTWKNIALSYFEYNFQTVAIYRKIIAFKKQNNP